jgi:hypothetical protein
MRPVQTELLLFDAQEWIMLKYPLLYIEAIMRSLLLPDLTLYNDLRGIPAVSIRKQSFGLTREIRVELADTYFTSKNVEYHVVTYMSNFGRVSFQIICSLTAEDCQDLVKVEQCIGAAAEKLGVKLKQ